MEVSWNRGTPFHHISSSIHGIFHVFYKPSSYSIGVPPWLRVSPIQIGDPWVAQGEMSNARRDGLGLPVLENRQARGCGKGQGKGMQRDIPSGNLT